VESYAAAKVAEAGLLGAARDLYDAMSMDMSETIVVRVDGLFGRCMCRRIGSPVSFKRKIKGGRLVRRRIDVIGP
jgi:hypothetical protein